MSVTTFHSSGRGRAAGREPGIRRRVARVALVIAAALACGPGAASASPPTTPGSDAIDRLAPPADAPRSAIADSVEQRGLAALPDSAHLSLALVPRPRGMADSVTLLPPVDVRGQRGLATDRATATSVRVDRGKANRFLPITVADALASVPGMDLVKMGPWASQLSMRGLSGDRVLLMVDGVRMNSVRGHGAQPSLVSLDRLDAVELMPGASSAQFGSDALGGVVNIVTQRSLFADRLSTTMTIQARAADPGQWWSNSARLRLTGRNAGFEISGGLGGLDHLHTATGAVSNSGHREEDYAVRGAARIGRASLDLEHTNHAVHDAGLPAFSLPLPGTPPLLADANSGSYPLQSREAQRAEFALQGRGALPDLHVLGVHQKLYTHFDEATVSDIYLRGRPVGTKSTLVSDRVTTDIASVQPSMRFRGAAGGRIFGEYRLERAHGPVIGDQVTRNLAGEITEWIHGEGVSVPPAERRAWAAGAAVSPVVGGFRLESSLRYDYMRSQADSLPTSPTAELDVTDRRTSAEAGVARRIGGVEPYGRVATGFRAPNLDERYFNGVIHSGMRLFGNPALESERSLSYEFGLRAAGDLPPWLRGARISAYRSEVEDLITFRYIGMLYLMPRFQYLNVQNARLEGVEGLIQLRIGSIQVEASAGYPKGTDLANGEPLADVGPPRAALEVVCPMTKLLPYGSVSTRLRWCDAVTKVGEGEAILRRPAFSTTSVEMSFVTFGVYTVLAVRNLWNHYYYEPQSFIPEPGRSFAISLRREFRTGLPF